MKFGSFVAQTTAGVQPVTVPGMGVGKLVKFFGGLTTVDDTLTAGHAFHHSLAVAGGAQREALSYFYDDNSAPANCAEDHSQVAVKAIGDGSGTTFMVADSFAFTSTGFQVNWTTPPAAAVIINYVIWEDSEVANVDLHTLSLPATATTAPKAGLGFDPNVLLTMHRMGASARGLTGSGGVTGSMFGWSLGPGVGEFCYGDSVNDNTPSGSNNNARRYERVDKCYACHQSGLIQNEGSVQSFDAGGYTLLPSTASASRLLIVAAIQRAIGSTWGAVVTTEPAATGTVDVPFGFDPDVVIGHGGYHVANNAIQVADTDRYLSVGSPTGARSYFGTSRQGTNPRTARRLVSPDFIRHYSGGDALIGRVLYQANVAGSVRLNYVAVTGTARRVLLLGIKSAPSAAKLAMVV